MMKKKDNSYDIEIEYLQLPTFIAFVIVYKPIYLAGDIREDLVSPTHRHSLRATKTK